MREIKFRAWDKAFKRMKTSGLGINYGVLDGDEVEILQYTGLKDKNGKEIYEGDIVKISAGGVPQESLEVVKWGTSGFELFNQDIDFYFRVGLDDIEVIGNIYETPELAKEATL